jgi:hypothetical protein
MRISIDLSKELKSASKDLDRFTKKRLPVAMMNSVNKIARHVDAQEKLALITDLDRPKPTTVKNAFILSKSDGKRPISALLSTSDAVMKNGLSYVYTGGTEPARYEFYPSPKLKEQHFMDQYGNIRRTLKGKIQKKDNRFIGRAGKSNKLGAWERTGSGDNKSIKLLGSFTPTIKHKKILDFFGIGLKATARIHKRIIAFEIDKIFKAEWK